MLRLYSISGATLAGVCAVSMFATSVAAEDHTTDIGTLDKETADKAFPAKPPTRPMRGAISRRGRISATRTRTPHTRWTPGRSALGSVQRTRAGSASRCNHRAQHCACCGRDSERTARKAKPDGAHAMAGRLQLWAFARVRFRRRAGGGRIAPTCDSPCAAVFQCRGGDRTACLCRRSAVGHIVTALRGGPAIGACVPRADF
jgi:hypothetical protein